MVYLHLINRDGEQLLIRLVIYPVDDGEAHKARLDSRESNGKLRCLPQLRRVGHPAVKCGRPVLAVIRNMDFEELDPVAPLADPKPVDVRLASQIDLKPRGEAVPGVLPVCARIAVERVLRRLSIHVGRRRIGGFPLV